ncbi:hypothetical protein G7Z17_g3141 [Cylindrodendrum hubeiense]|uniref:Uncharacterized protein n=1 Tax=Cylindrodendrum hubeiense TaxID=595255 RepID=A0A9P5LKB7_9HYPO|nr:hypothetical protein G7Z17_g3141 [Cylindrodendrum hubeiense]
MDPHDPSYGSHPSQSIPDAAYPDSSYQPSYGGSDKPPLGATSSPVSSHPQHQQQHSYSPSSSQPSQPSHLGAFSSQSSPNSSRIAPSPWSAPSPQGVTMPSGPPPPYDPTQPPSSYSPLDSSSHSRSNSRPTDLHIQPTPAASTHYPPSLSSAQSPHAPSPNPYSTTGSSLENASQKLGPVAEARLRKKRKMKICVVTMCAVILFIIALIIGVAVGVLKVRFNKDKHGGPDSPDNIQD